MSKVVPLPPSKAAENSPADPRVEQTVALVKTLIETLPPAEQEQIWAWIGDKLRAATPPGPRAGEVLGTIVQFLSQRKTWTAAELKQRVDERGVSASAKEVYNAIHYLARRGSVTRIGYGLYEVNGMIVATTDDLGGAPSRYEGQPDD